MTSSSMFVSLRRAVGRAIQQSDSHQDVSSLRRASGSGFKFGSWRNNDDMIEDFHRAVKNGETAMIERLLDCGCDIDCTRPGGKATTLMLAVGESDIDMARFLLLNGASVNGQRNGSFTPLMLACLKGNQQIVHLLLSSGANVNLTDSTDSSALIIASEKGYDELVTILLDHGANINHQSGTGLPPLNIAWDQCAFHNQEDDNEIYDLYNKNTSLMKACRENHLGVVHILIQRGADLQVKSDLGNTALLICCRTINSCFFGSYHSLREGSIENGVNVFNKLLVAGSDVSVCNYNGDTSYTVVLNQIRTLEDLNLEHVKKVFMLKNFYVVITELIKEGCDFLYGLNGESLYKLMFEAYLGLQEQERAFRHSWKPLCKLYKTIALAGHLPTDSDLRFLASGDLTDGYKNPLLTWLRNLNMHGHTLKQLCRIKIRQLLHQPYRQSFKDNNLKLSVYLKDYLIMEAT